MFQHYMLYFCLSVIAGAKSITLKQVRGNLYYDNCGISWRLKTLYREDCVMLVSLLIKPHYHGTE